MKRLVFLLPFLFSFAANAQTITTVAGTGVQGDSGYGGPATAALLHLPQALVLDKLGNMYIACHDHANHSVRKVDAAGIYTKFAGTGTPGYSGDGGPATAAQMNDPLGMCFDKYGNLYIAEEINSVIRKITPAGIISTIAGNGTAGYSGDGGPATAAQFTDPQSVKADTAGNLYVTDYGNNVVRKISTSGIITTFAGNGTPGYSGDGAPATDAQLEHPGDVAIDKFGNVYISEYSNHVIRKVTTAGIISTYAGLKFGGFAGDGGPATAARFWAPWGIEFDSSGNMLLVDTKNNRIRKISPTDTITTVAGDGTNAGASSAPWGAYGGDGGAATAAQVYWPAHIAIGSAGSYYFTDQSNNAVRRVDTSKPKSPLVIRNLAAGNNNISVVPNPNHGTFCIKGHLNSMTDVIASIEIKNVLGRVVYKSATLAPKGVVDVRISLDESQPKGMYLLQLTSGNQNNVIPIVIGN